MFVLILCSILFGVFFGGAFNYAIYTLANPACGLISASKGLVSGSRKNNPMAPYMKKWKYMNYVSHGLAIFLLVLSYIISNFLDDGWVLIIGAIAYYISTRYAYRRLYTKFDGPSCLECDSKNVEIERIRRVFKKDSETGKLYTADVDYVCRDCGEEYSQYENLFPESITEDTEFEEIDEDEYDEDDEDDYDEVDEVDDYDEEEDAKRM